MPLVLEIGQDGVGDAAVAHLDGVPVLHEAGDVLADPHDDLRVDPFGVFQEELVIRDDIIDVPDMDEGVAVDPGHEMVYLGDDDLGLLGGGFDDVNADAQA